MDIIITNELVELVTERINGESSLQNYEIQQPFHADFSLLVVLNYNGVPVVQKIARQVDAKTTDTRTQNKSHAISFYISTAVA